MTAKIEASVSELVGISIVLVMVLPLNGTQCRSDMEVSTLNCFCRGDLNNLGTLIVGAYFGMPISPDTLILFELSLSPIDGVRVSIVVLDG